MESRTKNRKTRAQVERMAMRAFGGMRLAPGDEALREMKEGWFNVAYSVRLADGGEVVLKIAPPEGAEILSYEKGIMSTEVASMRLVRSNPAIPVPEIFFYDDERDLCDSNYFFMEKIVGDNLDHAKESLPPETQSAIDLRIGEIIREINGFQGSYFGYDGNPDLRAATWKDAFLKMIDAVLDDGMRKGADYGFDCAELRSLVRRHERSLEEVDRPCLVHWDAWNPNFFVRDGAVVGIIDFERALWAEPLMEAQFRQFGGAGVSDSMRGYGKTTFTPAEEERKHLYSLHLALTMLTECYYRNYDTDVIFKLSKGMTAETVEWLKSN